MTLFFKRIILLVLVLISTESFTQTFSATLIDKKTNEPIPFATIQYAKNKGVITNEEGLFSFIFKNKITKLDSVHISSMGYESKAFPLSQKLDSLILLAPKTFELNSVFLSSNPLEVKEIIEKVKENLVDNYKVSLSKKKIFFRQSDLNKMKKVDFGFKKSTIEELNKQLIDSIADLVPRQSEYYKEVVGDFYGDYSKHKFHIDKAAELYDKSKDVSMDGLSDKIERIFKENVKPDSYIKIKSGIFSTKVQLDSLQKEHQEESEAIVKVENTDNQNFLQEIKDHISSLYEELFFNEDSKIDVFRKSNRYKFELKDYTYIDNDPVYIIDFSPKGKKDFTGTMYVNVEDYAVMRFEFDNVRPIKRFGLFGITYRHNVFKGKMLFTKDTENGYSPKYLELTSGVLFGLDRPLKVIEKNKHVKGRRKQNELSLALDIVMTQNQKYELVVFDSENISDSKYNSTIENKDLKATHLNKYDSKFWEGFTIMEPNAAIKAFEVID